MGLKKIAVLGSGTIGSAIALDLSSLYQVTAIDINNKNFEKLKSGNITTRIANLKEKKELSFIRDYDLVINAVPGHMGYELLKNIIKAKKNVVDISFFPEDPFDLDDLARRNNVTAIVDCGLAPGLGNLLIGYHQTFMEINSYSCYVGGLPVIREWPFQYKAVFSPIDVIEEYIRPARFVQNSQSITREALSDPEYINFPEIGTLEAFNTDGIRTLLKTTRIPNMTEKTLRYPGTLDYLKMLKKSGFFSDKTVNIKGDEIKPVDVTAHLLMEQWKLQPDEKDITVMRVLINGMEKHKKLKYQYDLTDRYDDQTQTSSMARTTGFTCSSIAHLFLKGEISHPGICPPEYVSRSGANMDFIFKYLADRNIKFNIKKDVNHE